MRTDKTYLELWSLVNNHQEEEVCEIAKMAINTIQRLQELNSKIVLQNLSLNNEINETIKEIEQVKAVYKDRISDIESLENALEEIKQVYTYGQPDHNGEIECEIEDTCEHMYRIAVNATTTDTNI